MKKYAFRKSFRFDGKRYCVYADTEEEAIAKMALKKRDLAENRVTLESTMLVRDWTYMAIDTYKTRQKPITREKYLRRVEKNVLEHIGSRR